MTYPLLKELLEDWRAWLLVGATLLGLLELGGIGLSWLLRIFRWHALALGVTLAVIWFASH